jgi:oligopeptide transport system ATP-binding protein
LLRVDQLTKLYRAQGGLFSQGKVLRAVDAVSLYVKRGETLGLVGESGSGKSTLARTALRLVEPTAGRIFVGGTEITRLRGRELFPFRKRLQMVYEDAHSSLNPRLTVAQTLAEPIELHRMREERSEIDARIAELLLQVGLPANAAAQLPHEFSAGQRQRIGIARALATEPELVVLDEPVNALDVSTQAQIINLLVGLQEERSVSYLFVAHDLKVVEHVSHRVAVMYLGRIVELGPTRPLYEGPLHPYTRALLSAVPSGEVGKRRLRNVLDGEPGSALHPPSGCAFHPRCSRVIPGKCDTETPVLAEVTARSSHRVACFSPHG